jgi:hypothetical protein
MLVGVEGLYDTGLTSLTEVLVMIFIKTHCTEITKISNIIENSDDFFNGATAPSGPGPPHC